MDNEGQIRSKAWEQAHGIVVGSTAGLPDGFAVGFAQNSETGTGCTVVLCESGAVGGVAVLGAAPATRETDLLRSENTVDTVHGLVLSGGSAFGLDAASGVVRLLEERGIGLSFSNRTVPIVVGASLFDLEVGDGKVTPDPEMGYLAAKKALSSTGCSLEVGNVGAGTGATVGKMLGMGFCMKGGFGAASIAVDNLVITALVAVNALGCVYDRVANSLVAGVRSPFAPDSLLDPYQALGFLAGMQVEAGMPATESATDAAEMDAPIPGSNTTIGCILTNAKLTKTQANRIALVSHDGYARAIEPVHTSFDGDAIFCLSHGDVIA
ncbi:MAG: P1 family peptidase, partial [Coriobacteriia bacterium]|nr:P1 family peptidase [Coriobacteriia bacterium]